MTDLVRFDPPSETEERELYAMAQRIAGLPIIPQGVRGKADAVLGIVLKARELNVPPMAALSWVDFIQNQPALNAEGHVALIKRMGGKIRKKEHTHTVCTVAGIHPNDPDYEHIVTFTMEDAKAAGLTGKSVWKQYPKSMLWARAITQLARECFPEVHMGLSYTSEELGADPIGADGPAIPHPEVTVEAAQEQGRTPAPAQAEPEVVDAEVVEEDEPSSKTTKGKKRIALNRAFHGRLKDMDLDYEDMVKPYLIARTGVSLSEMDDETLKRWLENTSDEAATAEFVQRVIDWHAMKSAEEAEQETLEVDA